MRKARVLFVSQEITPYLDETHIGKIARRLPQAIQEKGKEIRTFMPKYGNINERRHQLHEVIRLSGMNIVINNADHPLIIKVASIPTARMQVYFIDNDEYFKRKATFTDEEGVLYPDNDERAIFFAKGVVETVKKLNWVPDVIHVHGWMAAMLPIYLKHYYKDEGIFAETKIVTSVYEQGFEGQLDKEFINKILFDNISKEAVSDLENPTYENLMKVAIAHSDAVVAGSEELAPTLTKYIESSNKPFLPFASKETIKEVYTSFIKNQLL